MPFGHSKSGFSLVEILIALVIIAILGGVVGLSLLDQPDQARRVSARTQLQTFSSALKLYKAAHGTLPAQTQGLNALVSKPTTAPVPTTYPPSGYLDATAIPLDPWGNPYVYLIPGRKGEAFEIICYGADGEPGGEANDADLSSSDAN